MNAFVKRTITAASCGVAAAWCGVAAAWAGGWLQEVADPCYPERYEFVARQNTLAALAAQVQNGHVLDQTAWNFFFEPGTDRLTAGGLDHLAYLARRRPHPDCLIYLQTAQDVAYDPANPDRLVTARRQLDEKRIVSIKTFLAAQTAGRPVDFHVFVHDPADISVTAVGINNAVVQMQNTRFRGGLLSGAGGGGASVTGGGGATGASGGAGAAPAGGGNR